ncbi:MAG: C40 family peptidase [Pseudomonadota bacterium]|uniref:C40 family peptidase n=1 Tax=Methyloversatilis sp. TaxID=2569862 RepID=UPI00273564FC|nr:C40 family peptidase [Methyloversatilis sp.]MDP3874198.1 C40 family peptidase [Methyloversatilis sp.]
MSAGSRRPAALAPALLLSLALAACGSLPERAARPPAGTPAEQPAARPTPAGRIQLADDTHAQDAVIYALGLIGNHYQFGGRNPDSGLDCSGMVSWIYEQVAGVRLPHNAAQIAKIARPIERSALAPGDLVFFNTNGTPHSHMGIYAGEGRFIHAPSTRGKYVRTDRLDSGWFAPRISGLRTLRREG